MIAFDAAHAAVHYPADRRFRIWIRPSVVKFVIILLLLPVAAAWLQFGIAGLPEIVQVPQVSPDNFSGPHGFPLWVRYCHFFTPIHVPTDRIWTAKDDARYISPVVATPGYRHTVGIARVWRFINVQALSGRVLFSPCCCSPLSNGGVSYPPPRAWSNRPWGIWLHYAALHMPPEPNGFHGYNALQQIAYCSMVFISVHSRS